MAKIKFTAGRIESFKCEPGKSQSFLWDTNAPGLGLRATVSGAKSYIFQAKLRGQAMRITIGDPKTWDITAAESEARRLKVLIDNGHDPRQVKADAIAAKQAELSAKAAADEAKQFAIAQTKALEEAKQNLTARIAWDAYLAAPHPKWGAQHRTDHIIAASDGGIKSKVGDKITKAAPLASLLRLPLHSITAPVVQEWLSTECVSRPTFAHNSFRKFRTFIRWCAKHPEFQHVTHADCCLTDEVRDIIPANKTKDGDSLQREQLAAWFDAVRKISNPVISAYLQGLLITGARRGELELLRWNDVEFNPNWASLTIRDKVDGQRIIPLTPYLMSLLQQLPRRNEWVFSSPTAASQHITEPRIAHTRALELAGLPHVSLHGLRRSFGTLSEWVEAPIGIVAQIQGHKPSALAEKHYRRRPLDLLRMWHVKIEAWMLEQAGVDFSPSSEPPTLKLVNGI